jgi:phosphate transport system substrate-binding protein
VPASSPLTAITLSELADIFTGHGLMSDQFHAIGLNKNTALGKFMMSKVLSDTPFRADFNGLTQSRDVIKAIAQDPKAIGFAAAQTATKDVRALSLSYTQNERAVSLSEESIRSGEYPLGRRLLIYANGPTATEMDPVARSFLNLVLSCAGQSQVEDSAPGYWPLAPAQVIAERAKLTVQH